VFVLHVVFVFVGNTTDNRVTNVLQEELENDQDLIVKQSCAVVRRTCCILTILLIHIVM